MIYFLNLFKSKLFSEKEKNIENKAVHHLNEINSFETALINQHDLSNNELLQNSEILNELPPQQQPVIVRTPPAKLSRLMLDDEHGKLIFIFNFFFDIEYFFLYR